jgi:hypothetical protein
MEIERMSTEAVATASGSGVCACAAWRQGPHPTPSATSVEAFAAMYVARRHRLPPVLARLVVELAGFGRRLA